MSVPWTSRPFFFCSSNGRPQLKLFLLFSFIASARVSPFFFAITFFFASVARFAFMRLISDVYLMISKLLFPYRLFLGWRLLPPLLMMMVLLFERAKHTKNCVSKLFMFFLAAPRGASPSRRFSAGFFLPFISAYVGVTLIVAS